MFTLFTKTKQKISQNRGVTIFFAVLIIGILLSIGASISLLTQKQISLSSLGKQSELAFYAADSGVECVQYWDKNGSPDPFLPDNIDPRQLIGCNNVNVKICDNTDPAYSACSSPSKTFTVNFGSTCALITVEKVQVNGVWVTTVISHGYNDCTGATAKKLERAIQLTY